MSALYLTSRINCPAVRLHGQNASYHHTTTQGGFNTPLTRGVPFAIEQRISGADTLSRPVNGYMTTPEVAGIAAYGYNESGWNQSTSGDGGRTGASLVYMNVAQAGQGDYAGIWCNGIVTGSKAGATSYLASPAVECIGGELFGAVDGSYIEWLGDMDITDNGHDIAANGAVFGLSRTVARGDLGASWNGIIIGSAGTQPIDTAFRMIGPMTIGLDMSGADLGFWRLASITINSGGQGYAAGDTLTVAGGQGGSSTRLKVLKVGQEGALAAVDVLNTGIYKTPPVAQYGERQPLAAVFGLWQRLGARYFAQRHGSRVSI
jgi:hypothetical protein